MPYKLRKAPKRDLYWVVAEDGKHMSKEPLPKERAQAQMRALYAAHNNKMKGGVRPIPIDLPFETKPIWEHDVRRNRQGRVIATTSPMWDEQLLMRFPMREPAPRPQPSKVRKGRGRKLKGGVLTAEEQSLVDRFERDRAALSTPEVMRVIAILEREQREANARPAAAAPAARAETAAEREARVAAEVDRIIGDRAREKAHHDSLEELRRQTLVTHGATEGTKPDMATVKHMGERGPYSIYGLSDESAAKKKSGKGKGIRIKGKGMFGPDDDGPTFVKGDPLPMKNGAVDMDAFRQNVANNIALTQQGIKDLQASENAAAQTAADKEGWDIGMNTVSGVFSDVADIAGIIPGLGQVVSPLAGAVGDLAQTFKFGSGKRRFRGGGPMPPRSILHPIAMASYAEARGGAPPKTIGDWTLVGATPTLAFYKHDNTIVVGIRGTVGSLVGEDWRANYTIPFNGLASTNRFKKDLRDMTMFQTEYPKSQYDYYGVGHSLGGALMDIFISDGFLKNGVSYNPAIQRKDLGRNIPNERIYDYNDPLYMLFGQNASEKPEVRAPAQPLSTTRATLGYLHPALAAANAGESFLNAHALTNFEGGKKKSVTKR
jgi:hypothetical protein